MSGLPTIFNKRYSDDEFIKFLQNVKTKYEMITASEGYKNALQEFHKIRKETGEI